jgi:intracellular septation protein A
MKPGMFIGLAMIVFGVGTLVLRDILYIRPKKIIIIDSAKDVDPVKTSADEEK